MRSACFTANPTEESSMTKTLDHRPKSLPETFRHVRTTKTPLGTVALVSWGGRLRELHFDVRDLATEEEVADCAPCKRIPVQIDWDSDDAVLVQAETELREYFLGQRTQFSVPCFLEGTDFQQRVWKLLCRIPYGETRSYGELARMIGSPNASRAVGAALGKNPIGLIVPCHRVIGSTGKLVGFAGGITVKQQLLDHEHRFHVPSGRVK